MDVKVPHSKQRTMEDDKERNRKKLPGAKVQGGGGDGKCSSAAPPAKAGSNVKDDVGDDGRGKNRSDDDSDDGWGDDGWGKKRSGSTRVYKTKGSWKFARRTLAAPLPADLLPSEQLFCIDREGRKEAAPTDSVHATVSGTKRGREEEEHMQAKGGKDTDQKKRG